MKLQLCLLIFLAMIASGSVCAATASKDKDLGAFGAWRAYAYQEGGQTVCYMVTVKTLRSTGPKNRTPPYLMITHRPVEASTDVISYGAGAMLDSRHGVALRVGKNAFDLFSVRDTAWARDGLTDHKVAAALRSSPTAQFAGVPNQKNSKHIADIFDLTGASSAYRAINKACGLPNEEPKKTAPKKLSRQKRAK